VSVSGLWHVKASDVKRQPCPCSQNRGKTKVEALIYLFISECTCNVFNNAQNHGKFWHWHFANGDTALVVTSEPQLFRLMCIYLGSEDTKET